MKIIRNGREIAELPDKPKTFEGWRDGTAIHIYINNADYQIAKYSTAERADEVRDNLFRQYLGGAKSFILPDE